MRRQTAVAEKPMREEPMQLRGYLEYVLRDARPGPTRGRIVSRGKRHNVITFAGRSFALKNIMVTTSANLIMSAIALGTGTAATASSNVSMPGYFSIKVFGTTASTTATDSACTFTGAASWASNETHTSSSSISEFAIWNSNTTTSATMFNRLTTGTPINFATSNTLACTITITN